jgi:membrane fusion protein (multidrug efflux system)
MSADAKLTYVAAVDPIWVTFSVSQNQTAKLRDMVATGQLVVPKNQQYDVELVLSDGRRYPYKGRISFADPSFSQDTGSFMVRAVMPNPKMELRPGMFVTAYLQGAVRPDAFVVPQLAVQQGSNGHLVYVVNDAGTAEVRPVVVGDYIGEKDIVVLSGLRAGDRVVVDGVLKVMPGKPVRIVEAGAAGSAAHKGGEGAGKAPAKSSDAAAAAPAGKAGEAKK